MSAGNRPGTNRCRCIGLCKIILGYHRDKNHQTPKVVAPRDHGSEGTIVVMKKSSATTRANFYSYIFTTPI